MSTWGVNTRFDFTAETVPISALGPTHLIAIGGAGMSAVARLLLAHGVAVTGSDATESATLEQLRALGARVSIGHDAANVASAQTVVVSSAIPESNVELAHARAAGLRVLHRSQALASALLGRTCVAVAGANGKTTTSSLLASALRDLGADPSFALGGELAEAGTNAELGAGPSAIVEADESDGSFVVYRPAVAVVTNVQPDHLDFYGDFAHVQAAYREFVGTIAPGGLLVACADDPGSLALAQHAAQQGQRVLTYGFSELADARLVEAALEAATARATVILPEGSRVALSLAIPGEHNLLNASAALVALHAGLGVDAPEAAGALGQFSGTRRRFEQIGSHDGITVVDDYAHNAGKVRAVVATAARIAHPHALRVIFQPHLYSRTRDFAGEFAQGLAPATQIVLLDIYGAREEPMEGITSELIAGPLRAIGREVTIATAPEAIAALTQAAQPGDVLMTIGAGDVTALAPELLAALRAGSSAQPRTQSSSHESEAQ